MKALWGFFLSCGLMRETLAPSRSNCLPSSPPFIHRGLFFFDPFTRFFFFPFRVSSSLKLKHFCGSLQKCPQRQMKCVLVHKGFKKSQCKCAPYLNGNWCHWWSSLLYFRGNIWCQLSPKTTERKLVLFVYVWPTDVDLHLHFCKYLYSYRLPWSQGPIQIPVSVLLSIFHSLC